MRLTGGHALSTAKKYGLKVLCQRTENPADLVEISVEEARKILQKEPVGIFLILAGAFVCARCSEVKPFSDGHAIKYQKLYKFACSRCFSRRQICIYCGATVVLSKKSDYPICPECIQPYKEEVPNRDTPYYRLSGK